MLKLLIEIMLIKPWVVIASVLKYKNRVLIQPGPLFLLRGFPKLTTIVRLGPLYSYYNRIE